MDDVVVGLGGQVFIIKDQFGYLGLIVQRERVIIEDVTNRIMTEWLK